MEKMLAIRSPAPETKKARTASHFTAPPGDTLFLHMCGRSVLAFCGVLLVVAAGACALPGSASESPAHIATPPAQEDTTAHPPVPSLFHADPVSACSSAGGTYLGDMKCQMPGGSVAQIHVAGVGPETEMSAAFVPPKSPQAWALATTAIIFERNGTRHDLLGGLVITPENTESGRQMLSRWWGVNNRNQLLDMLRWLQFEGHRVDFDLLGRRVDSMNDQQFTAAEAALRGDPQQLHSLQVVRQYHLALGQPGILAWDLIRYIALCRWGYLAGYMSFAEAWDHIMPAARSLQDAFSSWETLQTDYLIGREFWSLQQTNKDGDRFRAISQRFLKDPNSPWNVNPWKMDLGVATPMRITAD